jgi:aspartate carbamoyltransferase catalytic subunit
MIDSIRGENVLSLDELSREAIVEVLDTAEAFVEVNRRAIKKVPALKGRVVASLFFEESTRTRLSFETAAKRLSADVLSLAVASSSMKKGESLRDTIATVDALGIDAVVMRHHSSGAALQVSRYVPHVRVINGGDGLHQHPTQGLLDAFTIRQVLAERRGTSGLESGSELFEGLHILIVGDIRHSRVARSDIAATRREPCCPKALSGGRSRSRTISMRRSSGPTSWACCDSSVSAAAVHSSRRSASSPPPTGLPWSGRGGSSPRR